jgi:predicted house-cleaning NTP pyrophosphatase (Maf/HAM1 superfamily)
MLVLASASPRRRELLAQAGYSFSVHPAHIAEDSLGVADGAERLIFTANIFKM